MDLNRKDSIVLPTGPTGGIGSAIAHAFAKEGAKLALSSTRQEKLDRLINGYLDSVRLSDLLGEDATKL